MLNIAIQFKTFSNNRNNILKKQNAYKKHPTKYAIFLDKLKRIEPIYESFKYRLIQLSVIILPLHSNMFLVNPIVLVFFF